MKPHPRYITTIERGNDDVLLVAIPVLGKRAVTKTLHRGAREDGDALLERAVRWRDRAWRRIHGGPVPARSFHSNARAASETGEPGVRLISKRVKKGEREYVVPCVIAEVHTIAGKDYARPRGSRSRLFSLNRFALDEAVALGSAWRAAQIAALQASTTT
jgi:hypothetical protein